MRKDESWPESDARIRKEEHMAHSPSSLERTGSGVTSIRWCSSLL